MRTDVGVERTPDGRRVVVTRQIESSRETVWEVLTDTQLWPEWGPSVRAVDAPQRHIERGQTGRIRVPGGLWVPYEITACDRFRWTWTVARVPATGHRVDTAETTAGECRCVFELPVLAAGYAPVCARALREIERLVSDANAGE